MTPSIVEFKVEVVPSGILFFQSLKQTVFKWWGVKVSNDFYPDTVMAPWKENVLKGLGRKPPRDLFWTVGITCLFMS